MKINNILTGALFVICVTLLTGCEKFLAEKSDKSLVVPHSLQDMQALLDLFSTMNNGGATSGEISADNYYVPLTEYQALPEDFYRNMYTWQAGDIHMEQYNDWYYTYHAVYNSNLVLDHLTKIPRTAINAVEWDHIKGQALTFRAFRFLSAIVLWAPAYDGTTAAADLGIPIRLGVDFNEPTERATVRQGYQQIIADLEEAIPLLPDQPLGFTRPSRQMAFALLARTHLFMRQYELAGAYADSALQINDVLFDYNEHPLNNLLPGREQNPEIFFIAGPNTYSYILRPQYARTDTLLYASFHPDDLRKYHFFQENADGSHSFKGNYTGTLNSIFTGMANDEVYLIRAESFARSGQIQKAMDDLNHLLRHRWDRTKAYTPLSASSPAEALEKVLVERRKQLIYRGLRWPDIKRLNKEGANITLTRKIGGETYTLLPNAPHYALPIPDDVIRLSGIPQNPR